MSDSPGEGVGKTPADWRILIVDDEESIRMFMEMLLTDVGYQVHTASGVQAALKILGETFIDLVVSDKNMEDGTGLDILEHVKANHPETELILMTANASLSSAVQAIHLGVGDYVQKPVDTDDFLARVERVLSNLELRRSNRALVIELKDKNSRLEEAAVRDGLTGLYNHAYFQDQLERELKRSQRHEREFSLVFIDVDNFKKVNDNLGHPTGDTVLRRIADLLHGKLGDSGFRFREHDVAARYGGDEFVLLLPETPKDGAAAKAEHLRSTFAQQEFDGVEVPVSLSLGVAAYPTDASTRADLVKAADTALYASKRLGRNRVMSYDPSQADAAEADEDASTTHALALEQSIAERSFKFVYQPIVDTSSMKPYAYEALCRPQDERFKHVGETIAAAERTGKVTDLGRVLRDLAVGAMDRLEEPCLLFVNLHPQELNDPDLIEGRMEAEAWSKRVVFEITEAARLPNFERPRRTIEALRQRGFRVALDDLGAGYAGLTTLTQLHPDYIKLDMALIRGIHSDSTSARLIRHLCHFCSEEGITMIAEGVETEAERSVVADLGCVLMQGYLFARPGPPYPDVEG